MTRRGPLLVRLAAAVAVDAARVVTAVAQWFVLDPCACRALGHNPQPLYDQDHTRVAVTCLRCGRTVET